MSVEEGEVKVQENKGKELGLNVAAVLLAIGALVLLASTMLPLWQAHATSPLLENDEITVTLTFWEVLYDYPGSHTTEPISSLSPAQQGALQLYLAGVVVTAVLAFVAAAGATVRYRRLALGSAALATLMAWAAPLAFTHYLPVSINEEPLIPFISYQFGFYGNYDAFFLSIDYGGGIGWIVTLVAAAILSAGALLLLWFALEPKAGTNAFK
jgi:hypothetical protein